MPSSSNLRGSAVIELAASTMTALPLKFDELGIDVLLAGTQKAFALPPGLALFVCSPAALAKAATMKDRGYCFDFVEFQKNAEQSMTPSTPSIGHIFALSSKLDDFFAEGLENRYARHRKTNKMVHDWAAKHGFNLFPEKSFESLTLTCVSNGAKPGGRTVDEGTSFFTRKPPKAPLAGVRMARYKMWFNPAKAIRELGLPQTPPKQAFADAVIWFRKNGYVKN